MTNDERKEYARDIAAKLNVSLYETCWQSGAALAQHCHEQLNSSWRKHHYFSPDTMRSFQSKVIRHEVNCWGLAFSILESVHKPDEGRVYRIAIFDLNGNCGRDSDTFFKSLNAAKKQFDVHNREIESTIEALGARILARRESTLRSYLKQLGAQ